MPSKRSDTALRDILHHIELANQFVEGFDQAKFQDDARTIYEEGVVIPPFKLYSAGERNDDALRIILNQVRVPDWNRADLNGLVRIIKRKLKKIQYRPHLIDGCLAATGLTFEPW